jgi:creatinine amidohydrolase
MQVETPSLLRWWRPRCFASPDLQESLPIWATRMFPDQLERRFAAWPVLYQTYGLCEPHGPQNAPGLDALKAHAIACHAARKHGGIVAPADYGHIHEIRDYAIWATQAIGEVERDWLTAVPPWHHFKTVCWHLRIADRLGFKAVILLTGHYGVNYLESSWPTSIGSRLPSG